MTRSSRAWRIAAAVTLASTVASCTSANDDTSTTISPADSTTAAPTTTVSPTVTTGTSYDILIETTYDILIETTPEGEVVVTGPEVLRVNLGSTVDLTILTSIDDMLHVHGYDLFFDLTARRSPSSPPGIGWPVLLL